MSNKTILLLSVLFMIAIFVFSMAFVAYKNYNKQMLQRTLKRQVLATQKDLALKDTLNIKFTKLEKYFIQAGIDSIYIEDVFLFLILLTIVILGISIFFNFGIFMIILPLCLVGGGIGFVKKKASKRIDLINKQFCESLDDIGDDLRINRNIYISIKNSLPTMQSPLKEEFELVCQNVDSNIDIINSLQIFSDRINTNIVQGWVDAVIFASEKKSNVSDVCKKYNKKIKKRLRTGDAIKGKLEGVKFMSLMILAILGGMIIMFYSTSPEFMEFLDTRLGVGVALYTVISIIVTTLFIFNKIDKEVSDI